MLSVVPFTPLRMNMLGEPLITTVEREIFQGSNFHGFHG